LFNIAEVVFTVIKIRECRPWISQVSQVKDLDPRFLPRDAVISPIFQDFSVGTFLALQKVAVTNASLSTALCKDSRPWL
jgi:hypothetical protein